MTLINNKIDAAMALLRCARHYITDRSDLIDSRLLRFGNQNWLSPTTRKIDDSKVRREIMCCICIEPIVSRTIGARCPYALSSGKIWHLRCDHSLQVPHNSWKSEKQAHTRTNNGNMLDADDGGSSRSGSGGVSAERHHAAELLCSPCPFECVTDAGVINLSQ